MFSCDVLTDKFTFGCDKLIKLYKKLDDIHEKNNNNLL